MPIPDPPNRGPDGSPLQFPTFDALYAYIQSFGRDNGFAAAIHRRANYNRDRMATRVELVCSRGKKKHARGRGIRNPSVVISCNCPWLVVARARSADAGAWTFQVKEQHNHDPSSSPAEHRMHRRLTPEMMATIRRLSNRPGIRLREIVSLLKDEFPNEIFTETDVKNYRQKIRREELGGLTPTQALIAYLRDNAIWHRAYLEEGHVTALFWTLPECVSMWKRFPTTLALDNTYQTKRFKMPLFNVTGMTNLGTIFNAGWGLVWSERAEAFKWLVIQLRALQQDEGIEVPRVILTDFEKGLKKALTEEYPSVQQQICIFHINANVKMQMSKRWIGPNRDGENDTEANGVPGADDREQGNNAAATQPASRLMSDVLRLPGDREAVEFPAAQLPDRLEDLPRSPAGMMNLWLAMVYAADEDDFWQAWHTMQEVFEDQESILTYLAEQWLPLREQWAGCYTSSYKNFGQRTTSPTESSNKMIKSYLLTGTSNLLELFKAIRQLVNDQQNRYYDELAGQRSRMKRHFEGPGKAALEDLPGRLSHIALEKVYEQFKAAVVSIRRAVAQPNAPRPPPCRRRFAAQYGIPCQHIIQRRIQDDIRLSKYDFDPHWWIDEELPANPLSQVREPLVVQGRGRPRNGPFGVPDNRVRRRAPPVRAVAGPQPPPPALRASVRRELSEWEGIDLPVRQPAGFPVPAGAPAGEQGHNNREQDNDNNTTNHDNRVGNQPNQRRGRQAQPRMSTQGGWVNLGAADFQAGGRG